MVHDQVIRFDIYTYYLIIMIQLYFIRQIPSPADLEN